MLTFQKRTKTVAKVNKRCMDASFYYKNINWCYGVKFTYPHTNIYL